MARYLALIVLVVFILVIVIPFLIVQLFPSRRQLPGEATLRVLISSTGQIEEIPLEEYVVGVVAAEMPASFPQEALRAQAVVARTYVLKRLEAPVAGGHSEGADICTDPAHCQGWISANEMRRRWGWWGYWGYRRRIEEAVEATRGLVLRYQGELIDPVYHSTCGGKTAAAEEVWGYPVAYLQSVDCPWDRDSPYYKQVVSLTPLEIWPRLFPDTSSVPVTAAELDLEIISHTPSGRVSMARLGSYTFTGGQLRTRLGLNSTNFTWSREGRRIFITTYGYGHGVGLCQYGARGMARAGKDFQDILKYYYTGVNISGK